MTPHEILIVEALARCSFCPGTSQKRFVRQMNGRDRANPLTERQSAFLWAIAWSWRRQLPRTLVDLAHEYSGGVGIRGVHVNQQEQYRKHVAHVTKVKFAFDERSAVPVDKLRAQGHRIKELQVGDKLLIIPDDRQGVLFAECQWCRQ